MRRREYDVVRGLAVIFMIAVHVMLTVYDGSSTVVSKLLLSIFYNALDPGYFSLFTWIVYPAAGYFFADVLRRTANEERLWRRVGISAGLVFAAMLTAFCLLPSVRDSYYADEYVYYRNGYFLLAHNLAFVVAWLSLWHFVKSGTCVYFASVAGILCLSTLVVRRGRRGVNRL